MKGLAQAIQDEVSKAFTYQRDIITHGKPEDWRSHYEKVIDYDRTKQKFVGDCDDFALTAAEVAHFKYSVPLEDLWLAICRVKRNNAGHLVLLLRQKATDLRSERWFVVDNAAKSGTAWRFEQVDSYVWQKYMSLEEKLWRAAE